RGCATQGSRMGHRFSLRNSLNKGMLWFGCVALAAGLGVGVSARVVAQSGQDSGAEARRGGGEKVVLKDGTFQLVRSYEKNGDRVKYFSLERGSWEEIPASMVDWDATAKAEKSATAADDALAAKIHKQEEAQKIDTTLDVDASLQVGGGTFLTTGAGLFGVEG